jgi:UDP-N-acetylmuramoyl-tripeptide--D-alanyl-D-alanine ligase
MAIHGGISGRHLAVRQLAALCEGTVAKDGDRYVEDVQVDSRKCTFGTVFFALPGERVDGVSFVGPAAANGCSAVVVPVGKAADAVSLLKEQPTAVIAVPDTVAALRLLAKNYIDRYSHARYVGVTGSCGKSTTKEAIAAIVRTMGKTVKTPGNLNSEIGLALSLLQMEPDTEYGIFEMGIDHVGEMDRMMQMVRPELALVTNIGISHLEKFGSREVIAREKCKIFHPDIEMGFLSSEFGYSSAIDKSVRDRLGYFDPADVLSTDLGLDGWAIHYEGQTFFVRAVGVHMLKDVVGAIKVAKALGASPEQVAYGLEGFVPMKGRCTVLSGEVTVIEDYYNASPDSTNSILDYLRALRWGGYKKAVLGPMKELGTESADAHKLVARNLMRSGLEQTFLYGTEMKDAYDLLRREGYDRELFFTEDFSELQGRVGKNARSGDLYLVKASRSVAMERLIPTLRDVV